MNRILLIAIDSKIPNLALKKIEKFHLLKGDKVSWNKRPYSADKIYVSCIFSKNKDKCKKWEGIAEIGGSGYDLIKTLPSEIDRMNPKINLGFTTRGCIKNCPFCIVWQKEGKIRIVRTLLDLWDGQSKEVTLLDNNILALFEWFEFVCKQARENKIRIDFNQGLDHQLLTQEIVNLLTSIRHHEYRFSFDSPSYLSTVDKAITLLQRNGIKRCMWYVLVGFNTTFEEDLFRIQYLRDRNQIAYVQRYNHTDNPIYIPLARWCNQFHIFRGMTWKQFIEDSRNKRYKKLLQEKGLYK